PRPGLAGAALRPRADDPRARRVAPLEAPRRHLGRVVSRDGLPAVGAGELPGPPRLVLRRHAGAVHPGGAGAIVPTRARGLEPRRLQPREARVDERAAPEAAARDRARAARVGLPE